ncbi:MAG: glycosyltransferase [Microthrixaceae bacterium]
MGRVISIVLPVHRNANALPQLHDRLTTVTRDLPERVEIVYVDDASDDGSWAVIEGIAHGDERVTGVRLRHNVGQQRAILAGVAEATGSILVTLDADLGNAPEDLPRLLRAHAEGHDCVVARRVGAGGRGPLRAAGSRLVNLAAALARVPVRDLGSSYLVLDRRLEQPIIDEFRRTGLELMLPSIVGLSSSPCWVDVSAPASPRISGYQLRRLAPMAGAFVAINLGPRLAAMAAAAAAAVGGIGYGRGRSWTVAAAALSVVSLGSLAASRLARRPVVGALYSVAERTDRHALTTNGPRRMVL